MANKQPNLAKSIGTWQVMVAGVSLVVAASTLVSDFSGFFAPGGAFAVALFLGLGINLLLLSAVESSVAYPKAGAGRSPLCPGRNSHFVCTASQNRGQMAACAGTQGSP